MSSQSEDSGVKMDKWQYKKRVETRNDRFMRS